MDGQREGVAQNREGQPTQGYEPPRVEKVLTPSKLEREILQAGPFPASADV